MVKIANCCYTNLNQRNTADEPLGEDITNEILVGTSPVNILSSINLNRRIIKIYTAEYSDKLAQVWVRHGTNVSAINSAFALPLKYLYVNTNQASRPLSVVCSTGTALLRLTVVNKL